MMRCGQVALYLVMTLVGITFLMLMNVGAYLGVTAKNRAMHAGDAAALEVAKLQGELLNSIGELNVNRLEAAIDNKERECEEMFREQLRKCLLGPLEGITLGNEAASRNGAGRDEGMFGILKQHVIDIRNNYINNPEMYPEAWEGAWEEYAQELELKLAAGIIAGPDNIDFVDAASGHPLLDALFYHAVAGRNWCYFHFNAPWLLDGYTGFRDWPPMPSESDAAVRRRRCINSEVYSLNLDVRAVDIRSVLGDELIMKLTGRSLSDIENSHVLTNSAQAWFFYDTSRWRKWYEMDPNGEWKFPVLGKVKEEYDVRGCAAVCRVVRAAKNLFFDDGVYEAQWSAAAKPFGTLQGADGGLVAVTQFSGFVVPAFTEVRLVPLDSVGGRDLATADFDWMLHLREHLPRYLDSGVSVLGACYYCLQLRAWESESFRSEGRRWLKLNSGNCIRSSGSGTMHGGTPHGH